MLSDSWKVIFTDKKFSSDIDRHKFINHIFNRLVAKEIKFKNVDFKYCVFDSAYLRICVFDSCDFTGCKFINSNLLGSSFNGCVFDYASFENTQIDNDILSNSCPSTENLKLKFARTLRTNYQQLGDAKSANIAIGIELQATEIHYHKAWKSKESYYRKKYKGMVRLKMFIEWLEFKLLDIIWGNGESTIKLLRFSLFIMFSIALVDVITSGNSNNVTAYISSFLKSPQIFLGVEKPFYSQFWYIATIVFARLIIIGLFLAILIKRFSRR